MISIRHCGIYVSDIQKMENFYENVFRMHYICRQEICCGEAFDILAGAKGVKVLMSKLITEKGKSTGEGDMVELLQMINSEGTSEASKRKVTDSGMIHIALECRFSDVLPLVEKYGGKIIMEPIVMESGNGMCFVTDPEGNYIELIEREKDSH